MNRRNLIGGTLITLAVLVVSLSFIFFLFPSEDSISFSPEENIATFVSGLEVGGSSYNVITSDGASSEEISVIANFAGFFGLDSKAYVESEYSSNQNVIVVGVASEFSSSDNLNFLDTNDAIIIYDPVLNSLFIYAKDVSSLESALNIIKSGEPINYPAVKINGGVVEELVLVSGPVFEITREISNIEYVGETAQVTLTVKVNYNVDSLIVGETIPLGWEFSQISPATPIKDAGQGIISWISFDPVDAGEYVYTYNVVPHSEYGEFSGKVGGVFSSKEYEAVTTGETSLRVDFECVENWACSGFSPEYCPESGQRTQDCWDENSCGTELNKPEEVEFCSPSCDESGDFGIDIFNAGSIFYAGVEYIDECLEGNQIREYACGESGKEEQIYGCFECSEGACLREYACENGEEKSYSCSNGKVLNSWCVCNDHSWVCSDEPEVQCPVSDVKDIVRDIDLSDNARGYKIVIGKDAAASDTIGSIELAGKFRITETVLDDNVMNAYDEGDSQYLIVVGGPAVNRIAAKILNVEYPSHGSDSTIPAGHALIRAEKSNGIKILVAGYEAVQTRNAIKALKDYDLNGGDLSSEIVSLSGGNLGEYYFV